MAKLDYYNITHKGLSYSRQLTLHACPRKYELDAKANIKAKRESVTFSYGHAVGTAVQSTLSGHSLNRTLIDTVLAYTHNEDDAGTENEQRAKKSIWWAVVAAEEFWQKYNAGLYKFLEGWEVATYTNSETGQKEFAVELTFVIDIADGFSFEGHIDLVLWHPKKKKLKVVELKTTGSNNVDEASYKNSAQALGYGAVLDLIAQNMKVSSSFDVLYLVYMSRKRTILPMLFHKTVKDRVDWLGSVISDMKIIELYEEYGYPKHGESCFDFFRQCEYFGICNLSDNAIDRMFPPSEDSEVYERMSQPTFFFTMDELMQRQESLIQLMTTTGKSEDYDDELLLDVDWTEET